MGLACLRALGVRRGMTGALLAPQHTVCMEDTALSMTRTLALGGLLAVAASAMTLPPALAQEMPTVVLVSPDKVRVGERLLARKDMIAALAKVFPAGAPIRLVQVKICPGQGDGTQDLLAELQRNRVIAAVDHTDPEPRLCAA